MNTVGIKYEQSWIFVVVTRASVLFCDNSSVTKGSAQFHVLHLNILIMANLHGGATIFFKS